ncbi:MAG: sigma-70 family RNA polymerase sigma factor [Planctomycetota bacterium]
MDPEENAESNEREPGAADLALVRNALAGDPATRVELENRLVRIPELVRACHARMGRPLGADDLDDTTQDVSLTVCCRLEEFRGTSRIETWIYGIARISILSRLQTVRRELARSSSEESARDVPSDAVEEPDDTGLRRIVNAAVQTAGDTVEAIVRGRHLSGESFQVIGRQLGMPEATVKSRYYRAIPLIRRALSRVRDDA